MRIQANLLDHELLSVAGDDLIEENELQLDSESVETPCYCTTITFHLHILIHPVYSIPYPYFRFWNNNGKVLDAQQTQLVVDKAILNHKEEVQHPLKGTRDNHFEHILNKIEIEDHPILQEPYFTFHFCTETDKLRSICNDSIDHQEDASLICSLVWLSMFGKFIGMPMSPNLFNEMRSLRFFETEN